MTHLKEFSYSNIFQRKIIYANAFLTFLLMGIAFSSITLELNYYFYYYPIIKVIFVSLMVGIFLGNIAGRGLFSLVKGFRYVYISSEILFIIACLIFFLRSFIITGEQPVLMQLFNYSPVSVPLLMGIISFFAGIKINYFIKISCGTFIDDRHGLIHFITFLLLGIAIGIPVPYFRYIFDISINWDSFYILYVLFAVLLVPGLFILKLPFNPEIKYAQHYPEDDEKIETVSEVRDSLIFTYLNFSFAIIYIILGLETVIKFYGDLFYVKISFIIICLFGLLLGFMLGKFIKSALSHVYTEIIYPVLFLPFIYSINQLHSVLPFYLGILIMLPALFIFGYSLNHTVVNILNKLDHRGRFSVIDFSLFILPVPILISLSFIDFTYKLYFGLVYLMALLNIIVPGFTILSKKIKGYKKAFYFVLSLFLIVAVIFTHQYFRINLSNDIYVSRLNNFDKLSRTNFNSQFIKTRGTVLLNKEPVFKLSDSNIRNMKRSLVPLSLYIKGAGEKVLFLDSNQKFFKNPVIGYYKNSVCLDNISKEKVDYKSLPVSGRKLYIPDEDYILFYLNRNEEKYSAVVDIPNILDQNRNYYRFTGDYYKTVKERIKTGGIFMQVYDINSIRKEFISRALKNLEHVFKSHSVYLFSNILVILSSDSRDAFKISKSNYTLLSEFLQNREELGVLFYNEMHLITHMVSSDIKYLKSYIPEYDVPLNYFIDKHEPYDPGLMFYDNYTDNNDIVLKLINNTGEDEKFKKSLEKDIELNKNIYSLIKKTELAESNDNYDYETRYLFELKKFTEYRTRFREYLDNILSYKEEYYFNTALRLESDKRWEDAKILYTASLRINEKNFETNYRLGLLCITLQDIDNAFKHLQSAMKLDKNHPKVLYQMGVLLFSNGRTLEAIDYLQRALDQREISASLYLYMGLSYEKLGKLNEAESFYSKALIKDPNDDNIKDRLNKIKKRKEEDKIRWKVGPMKNEMDVEKGENFPLPINKSAFDWRLTDKEAENLKDDN